MGVRKAEMHQRGNNDDNSLKYQIKAEANINHSLDKTSWRCKLLLMVELIYSAITAFHY